MVRDYLKVDCGVRLAPRGVYREDFDAGMKGGVGELLDVVVNDVGDGVPEAVVGELWKWQELMWAECHRRGGILG